MQEIVQTTENAVCRVRETENGVDRAECEAAGPRKLKRPERGRELLVRDGVCFPLEKLPRAAGTE